MEQQLEDALSQFQKHQKLLENRRRLADEAGALRAEVEDWRRKLRSVVSSNKISRKNDASLETKAEGVNDVVLRRGGTEDTR